MQQRHGIRPAGNRDENAVRMRQQVMLACIIFHNLLYHIAQMFNFPAYPVIST
jgi:hypothetical protein